MGKNKQKINIQMRPNPTNLVGCGSCGRPHFFRGSAVGVPCTLHFKMPSVHKGKISLTGLTNPYIFTLHFEVPRNTYTCTLHFKMPSEHKGTIRYTNHNTRTLHFKTPSEHIKVCQKFSYPIPIRIQGETKSTQQTKI